MTFWSRHLISPLFYAFGFFFLGSCSGTSSSQACFLTGFRPASPCGSVGNSCYDNAAALSAGVAVLSNDCSQQVDYVPTGNGFSIWKEHDGNRILHASGLWSHGWQNKLNLNGKGYSTSTLATLSDIAGRTCPLNVYLDDSTMFDTSRCLYFDSGNPAQTLDKDGISQSIDGQIGIPDDGSIGFGTWYAGNIQTCASKGMRLPTVYEAAVDGRYGVGGASSMDTYPYLPHTPNPIYSVSKGISGITVTDDFWFTATWSDDGVFGWYNAYNGSGPYTSENVNPAGLFAQHLVRCVLP